MTRALLRITCPGAVVLACLVAGSATARAQLWSGVIAPERAIDWTVAGATITRRTVQCGSTIAAYTGSADVINAALAACPAGQFVQLGAGTFVINSGGAICPVSNVTLRGRGADQTKILSTTNGACSGSGYPASLAFAGAPIYPPSPPNVASWTGGYGKGETVITLSNTTNLQVGSILMLDQDDDPDVPVPDLWVCKNAGVCSSDGAVQFFRPDRNQVESVRVAAINGDQVTLERGLFMPNWRPARNPGAYWATGLPLENAGVEDLSIDTGGNGEIHAVLTESTYNSWLTGVRIIDGNPAAPKRCLLCSFASTVKFTTKDNYIYGSRGAVAYAGTYGYELRGASQLLHLNNIWEDDTAPFVQGQGAIGNVWAYNYTYSGWYVAGDGGWPDACGTTLNCVWMQAAARYHAIANNYTLFEGNDSNGFAADALRGASFFGTAFRNAFAGWDAEGGATTAAGKQQQTVAIHIYAYNRFFNLLGNVLGHLGTHSGYQCKNATTGDSCTDYDSKVFVLGYSGNGESNGIDNDARVWETLYRWGNWDVVTQAARFCGDASNTGWSSTCGGASEVPTGDGYFPQPIPTAEMLPSSLLFAARPSSWWRVGAVTPAWPPIGPDVSGGDVPDLGGHVHKIPARLAYEGLPLDGDYPTQRVKVFSATVYTDIGGAANPPAAPTNLSIVP